MPFTIKTFVGALALFAAAANAVPYAGDNSSAAVAKGTKNTNTNNKIHCSAPYKPARCEGLLCTLELSAASIASPQDSNANACCDQTQGNGLNVNIINCAAILA